MSRYLPFDRLADWIYAFVVVNFDIDYGQIIECIYPTHINLSDTERNIINYSSFPDSHSAYLGDSVFHYRMPCSSFDIIMNSRTGHFSNFVPYLKPTPGYCFAYVLFRQVKDTSLRRNYFQKSVVLLSPYPFDALFIKLISIIAPEFFEKGETVLESACSEIDKWPLPQAGKNLFLTLMSRSINICIPLGYTIHHKNTSDKQHHSSMNENVNSLDQDCINESEIDSSLHQNNYAIAFNCLMPHLQRLWEIVITGQQILVIGHSPTQCSRTVQCLVSCIAPLYYAGEFRPFFTIHDPSYKELTKISSIKGQNTVPIILGVTNPFFSKVIGHWPNIIKLDSCIPRLDKLHKLPPKTMLKSLIIDDTQPGLYSKYKTFLKRSKIFKTLKQEAKNPEKNESKIAKDIKHAFFELTRSFLNPLERYVVSLMPLQKSISPFMSVPKLGRFKIDDFLNTLSTLAFSRTKYVHGDWVGLYKSFISSPHFASWFGQREHEINQRLEIVHIEAICDAQVGSWLTLKDRSEVEKVDFIITLNEKLQSCMSGRLQVSATHKASLSKTIDDMIQSLPADLRKVIQSSNSGTGFTLSTFHKNLP